MNILFVIEQYCDCNPALGLSGPLEYYVHTWRSLNAGPDRVIHYDNLPVEVTITRVWQECRAQAPDLVLFTEVFNHPSAQIHSLWPKLAARGISVAAVWHDSVKGTCRDLPGIRVNILVDTTVPRLRSGLALWTPHDTALFYGDPKERDLGFVFPSSKNHKPFVVPYIAAVKSVGLSLLWTGGQREDKLSFEDYARLFGRAKIILNFAQDIAGMAPQLKGRVAEALYSGALLLDHRNPHTSQMLADGQEYVSFDSPDDLVAKATYYLQHEEERVRIARAGQERALQHYSPRAWWQALCAAVGKAL